MSAQSKKVGSPDAASTTLATSTVSSVAEVSGVDAIPTSRAAANDSDKTKADSSNNLIRRTVEEIYGLMAEVHEIREELLAHGVQFHMLNALIEMGVHDKPEEQSKMIATAVEASVKAHGPQAIQREELEGHLSEIVTLEKDLRHVRHVASQQGVHMQALNHLTQLMRLNPGDKGVQAINTFVAYADAAGVPLDRLEQIRSQFQDGPNSVLPDIPRENPVDRRAWLVQLAQNVVLGLVLSGIVMWMVL